MLSFNNYRLKSKLVSIIALVTVFILILSTTTFVLYDRETYRNNLLGEQTITSNIIASQSSASLLSNDRVSLQENLEALRANPRITIACIYLSSQLISSYFGGAHILSCPQQPPTITSNFTDNQFLVTLTDIKSSKSIIGTLYIASSLSILETRTANFTFISIFLLLAIGTIGLIIAANLISVVIKPLSDLENTANSITKNHDYSVRSGKHYDDDVGQLITNFNNMLDTIENKNAALKKSEETLRSIIVDAPDLIQIIDREGRITFTNRPNELTALDLESESIFFNDISPEHRIKARNALDMVFDTGLTTQFEALDASQSIWHANHLGPLKENGQVNSVLVMKRDISALKHAHEKLTQIAYFDPLTNLPNRRLFKERLKETLHNSQKEGTHTALLFLDLDNFKRINDTLGHDVGDNLLKIIADRLMNCVRNEDLVCRLGGDEFTILLGGLSSKKPPLKIAEKILCALREPIRMGNEKIISTFSIGIAIAPDHANNTSELMQHADIAMYEAKKMGKNTYRVFEQSMARDDSHALNIEAELREAIDQDQFQVYYQPQYCLKSQQVIGIEALLRWNHPERGLISPGDFLHELENYGYMMEITQWVLNTACREINAAAQTTEKLKHLKLSINISAQQFNNPQLVSFIRTMLDKSGFPVKQLELEITETSLVVDFEQSIRTMKELSELGVSLCIDDFGTGYSSLNYLRKLPINLLKIDRSFICDIASKPEEREISSAIIAMAHKLNIAVLAEGVESPEQLTFLKQQRCDYVQGFYISPPVPVNALAYLSNSTDEKQVLSGNIHDQKPGLRLISADR